MEQTKAPLPMTPSKIGRPKGSKNKPKLPQRLPDIVIQMNDHGDTAAVMTWEKGHLNAAFPGGKGKHLYAWARKTYELHAERSPRQIIDKRNETARKKSNPSGKPPTTLAEVAALTQPKNGAKVPDLGPAPRRDWLLAADPKVRRAVEYVQVMATRLGGPLRTQFLLALRERLENGTL